MDTYLIGGASPLSKKYTSTLVEISQIRDKDESRKGFFNFAGKHADCQDPGTRNLLNFHVILLEITYFVRGEDRL